MRRKRCKNGRCISARFYFRSKLAIHLPTAVAKALKLKEGDEIEIHFADVRELGAVRR
jgi:hypothetical protein